jgi:aryl-alcohol dehydrogenase-like predicted oxidoreductase
MTELMDDGLVRSIGVSNFDRDLIERCEAIRHVDTLQQEFSMLRLEDRDLIRWCGEQGTGVLSYGPLAYGLLTGAITSETRFDRGDFRGGDEEGGSLFVARNRSATSPSSKPSGRSRNGSGSRSPSSRWRGTSRSRG